MGILLSKEKTSKKQPIFRSNRMDYKSSNLSKSKENIGLSTLNHLSNYKRRPNFVSTLPFNKSKLTNFNKNSQPEYIKVARNLIKESPKFAFDNQNNNNINTEGYDTTSGESCKINNPREKPFTKDSPIFKFSSDNDLNLLFQENVQLRTLMSDYLSEIDDLRSSYSKLKVKYKKLKEENSENLNNMKKMEEIIKIYEERESLNEKKKALEKENFKKKLKEDIKNLDDCLKIKEIKSRREKEKEKSRELEGKRLHNRFHSFSSLMKKNPNGDIRDHKSNASKEFLEILDPEKRKSLRKFRASSHDLRLKNPFKSKKSYVETANNFFPQNFKKKRQEKNFNYLNRKNSLNISKSHNNIEISRISEEGDLKKTHKFESSFEMTREKKLKGRGIGKIFTKRNYFDKNRFSQCNVGNLSQSKFLKMKSNSRIFDKSRSIANFKDFCLVEKIGGAGLSRRGLCEGESDFLGTFK